MADVSGYVGDNSGIGQGLAFILPDSKSQIYAQQLAQTHATQLQALARQKQAQALKAQEDYQNDFKSQKLPEAFAPFDKLLNDRHNKWQQEAAASYATTGKNPFNNPDFIKKYNDEVITPARESKDLGANYTKLRSIAETDPTNKYTKESKQAVIDYESKIKSDPIAALNSPLPQLKETPATIDDLVKTLKPVKSVTDDGRMQVEGPNSSNHKAQAFSALLGDPKWHDTLKGFGYNPDLPDFGVYTDPKNPTGKRVWYTNPAFTDHQAELILSAPTDPRNAQILQSLGIHPEDQFAREKLQHAITDQNSAMGKAVTAVADRLDAAVPTSSKRVFGEERMALAEQNLANSNERLALAQEKAAKTGEKDTAPTVRQDLIERMRTSVPNSGEEVKAIVSANQAYDGPLEIKHDPKNKNIQLFTVPAKTVGLNTIPKHTIKLDTSNPATYQAGMNQLLNDVTGEHVTLSKVASPQGKGKVPGGLQNPTIKPGAPYKASDGKTYKHDELLKLGYTEEQILQAIKLGNLKQ